ncbi:hypothetical protein DRW03_10715 [Corallococcus sp. H22C18031201]|uniref:glycosyl hydrolase family 28-related protein n=1 Tax=Citreicoccus inhibens TaxID=2849499 RepID=UPI000E76CA33|nr:glycosyl hydrolase family 28-related protein [Citreicoccus inhibens]MBU8898885.1 hypothetical protein [Citreicoccus inhibens]RJS24071.1 hypothetical protein DRW03_10715 [Corallococcus sp. H22C18031201]
MPNFIRDNTPLSTDPDALRNALLDVRTVIRSDIDVKNYGAVGDGIADDTSAIQAALDAAQNAGPSAEEANAAVRLPAGRYRITRPLRMRRSYLRMHGDGKSLTTLINDGLGPAIYISDGVAPTMPLVSPLALGPGLALDMFSRRETYSLNLRELPSMDLDGLPQFSVQCYFRPKKIINAQMIISSWGSLGRAPPTRRAFVLSCGDFDNLHPGCVSFKLTVGGQYLTARTADYTLQVERTYHLEASYDGVMMRVFVDGKLLAWTPATGTLNQEPWEDVILGGASYYFPQSPPQTEQAYGYLDSVHLSRVARHTAAFPIPTRKHVADADTLALLNFDGQADGLMQVQVGAAARGFVPVMNSAYEGGLVRVEVSDLRIAKGNGIYARLCVSVLVEDVIFLSTRYGIRLTNNCYLSRVQRVSIFGGVGTIFGISVENSGVTRLQDIDTKVPNFPIIVAECSVILDNIYNGNGIYNLYLVGSLGGAMSVDMRFVVLTDEDFGFSNPRRRGVMYAQDLVSLSATNCTFEALSSPDTPIIDIRPGSGAYVFTGSTFNPSRAGPRAEVFRLPTEGLPNPVIRPIKVLAPGNWKQLPLTWSQTPGAVSVEDGSSATNVRGLSAGDTASSNFSGTALVPPGSVEVAVVFPRPELDAAYRIIATANAAGAPFVTQKAATGFTLNLTNEADQPVSVDWLLLR